MAEGGRDDAYSSRHDSAETPTANKPRKEDVEKGLKKTLEGKGGKRGGGRNDDNHQSTESDQIHVEANPRRPKQVRSTGKTTYKADCMHGRGQESAQRTAEPKRGASRESRVLKSPTRVEHAHNGKTREEKRWALSEKSTNPPNTQNGRTDDDRPTFPVL